eukprot:4800589-Pyramimonas_sp.AAC.1
MPEGATLDTGYKDAGDMDSPWRRLCVMLSKTTASDNLPMVRETRTGVPARAPWAVLTSRIGVRPCGFREPWA